MSTGSINTGIVYSGWGWNPIDMEAKRIEGELRMRNRGKDPELPPDKEPGDIYVLIGMLVGFICGGIIGFTVAASGLVAISLVFLLVVGGAIAGGIIGATIGGVVKKRIRESRKKKTYQEDPFIDD